MNQQKPVRGLDIGFPSGNPAPYRIVESGTETAHQRKDPMAVYEYEHTTAACSLGRMFEVEQSIHDKPLVRCPRCNEPVHKLISRINIKTSRSNAELRDLGFTKLVKRDDGVYENVTRRKGESRYMERGKPETMPNVKKIVRD